jgi:4-amino-4-deoxy-L-arabinose transferase-like glycosyltransferase
MEAAALGRSNLSTLAQAVRHAVRSRSRAFWIVAGLTAVAAALRFSTLGLQSYHHDEIVTASRILRDGFWHAMSAVGFSESAPPLYYALAWLWTQLTGTGEFGLRSISALAGVATVPVAYLVAVELRGRRAGIAAAALVAVNPMLLWYSQEARAYALFALLTSVSLLYFVRALDRGRRRDLTAWGIASALALATHYFAVFPIAAEALWLLRRRGRAGFRGLWIVALTGLLLTPLAIHQMSIGHAEWIGNHALFHRLWEAGVTFMVGETGDIVARPEHPLLALAPALLVVAALVLLLRRGEPRERRAAGVPLAIAAAAVGIPVLLALASPGKDYVLARNLMPALVPLLVAVAVSVTLRGARRRGLVLGAALVAYSLGFCVWASLSPALQRPDWGAVAAKLGEPVAPRAIVTWTLGEASLRYYLSTGSFQASAADGFDWLVHEVDFVSDGPAAPVSPRLLGPGFRKVGYEQAGRLYVRRYALPGPGLARLRLRMVRRAPLNFRTNGVLLDGIGPE